MQLFFHALHLVKGEPSNHVLACFIELGKWIFTVLTRLFFPHPSILDLTGDYTLRVHSTSLTPCNPHCFTHKQISIKSFFLLTFKQPNSAEKLIYSKQLLLETGHTVYCCI